MTNIPRDQNIHHCGAPDMAGACECSTRGDSPLGTAIGATPAASEDRPSSGAIDAATELLYGPYSLKGADLERCVRRLIAHKFSSGLTDDTLARFAVEAWLGIDNLSDLVAAVRLRMADDAHECSALCPEHGDVRDNNLMVQG